MKFSQIKSTTTYTRTLLRRTPRYHRRRRRRRAQCELLLLLLLLEARIRLGLDS